jgi:cyanate permease
MFLSVILILYSIVGFIKSLFSVNGFSSYEAGMLVGSIILLTLGILLFLFALKSLKKKNHE